MGKEELKTFTDRVNAGEFVKIEFGIEHQLFLSYELSRDSRYDHGVEKLWMELHEKTKQLGMKIIGYIDKSKINQSLLEAPK